MNRKGFTLIELLATLVILGIVLGIAVVSVTASFKKAKDKTEDIYVGTLEDALDMYLDNDARKINYSTTKTCTLNKTHRSVNVYKSTDILTFNDIINSSYSPLQEEDLINPANEKTCKSNASVEIYRDDDFVYYYKVNKDGFDCLKNGGFITNLPSECY